MNVRTLIEKLSKADQDKEVLIEVDETKWTENVVAVFECDKQHCVVISPSDWDKNSFIEGVEKL